MSLNMSGKNANITLPGLHLKIELRTFGEKEYCTSGNISVESKNISISYLQSRVTVHMSYVVMMSHSFTMVLSKLMPGYRKPAVIYKERAYHHW